MVKTKNRNTKTSYGSAAKKTHDSKKGFRKKVVRKRKKRKKIRKKRITCENCKSGKAEKLIKCADCKVKRCGFHNYFRRCTYGSKIICGGCINYCSNDCRNHWNGQSNTPTKVCDEHSYICNGCQDIFCCECIGDIEKLTQEQQDDGEKYCWDCTEEIGKDVE